MLRAETEVHVAPDHGTEPLPATDRAHAREVAVEDLEGIADAVAGLALRYLRKREETRKLVDGLKGSNAPGAARAAELLSRSGTRAALEDFD